MIDLLKAKEIVKEEYPEFIISSIGKIEKGWIFAFENKRGKPLQISPVFVSEENGTIETFFPPEHKDELQHYTKIDIKGEK